MSKLNIVTSERKVIITVKEVLERYLKHAAGFPGIKIMDEEDREHTIAYVDCACDCDREVWNNIGPGTKITVTIQESISGHLKVENQS